MTKQTTVNVVRIEQNRLVSIQAFKNNAEGIEQAEKTFISLIQPLHDQTLDADGWQYYIDIGYFNDKNGHEFYMTYSDNEPEKV